MLPEVQHHRELALQHEELRGGAEIHHLQAAALTGQVFIQKIFIHNLFIQKIFHPRRFALRVCADQAGECLRSDQSQQVVQHTKSIMIFFYNFHVKISTNHWSSHTTGLL